MASYALLLQEDENHQCETLFLGLHGLLARKGVLTGNGGVLNDSQKLLKQDVNMPPEMPITCRTLLQAISVNKKGFGHNLGHIS
jgi:hypothetical protein